MLSASARVRLVPYMTSWDRGNSLFANLEKAKIGRIIAGVRNDKRRL